MTGPDDQPVSAVDVYWRPGCIWCATLRHQLRKSGLPMREHDIWADQQAAATVRSITGGDETVPTVRVGRIALVAPGMSAVRRAVEREAPHLVTSPTPGEGPRRRWWRRARGEVTVRRGIPPR